jgi:two-component system nitrogen regulation response regulator NtrX
MSFAAQGKILRVLQEQKFQRVGGSRILELNARVIAASNKDLEKEIGEGNFREELYYRLNVIPIEVPSLRNRQKDIPLLVKTFLAESAEQNQRKVKSITPEAVEMLQTYIWPGNVRELKNLIERLAIMVNEETIDVSDIPGPYNPEAPAGKAAGETDLFRLDDLKGAKNAFEVAFIKQKLSENDQNISQTAKAIGVGRSYLYKRLKEVQ